MIGNMFVFMLCNSIVSKLIRLVCVVGKGSKVQLSSDSTVLIRMISYFEQFCNTPELGWFP